MSKKILKIKISLVSKILYYVVHHKFFFFFFIKGKIIKQKQFFIEKLHKTILIQFIFNFFLKRKINFYFL